MQRVQLFVEALVPFVQGEQLPFDRARRPGQQLLHALQRLEGLGEVAAVGLFAGLHPGLGGFLQLLQLGRPRRPVAQLGDGLAGPHRLAAFKQRADFRQAVSRQGLAEVDDGRLGGAGVFGLEQVGPGAGHVVLPQVSVTALGKGPRQLLERLPGPRGALDSGLGQEPLGVVKPAALERFLGLPQC